MKALSLVAVILPLLISTTGCYPVKEHPIDGNLKKAYNFKEGSYWLYKDSISGAVDSFYVATTTTRMVNDGSIHPPDEYETINISIKGVPVSGPSLVDTPTLFWNLGENLVEGAYFVYKPNNASLNISLSHLCSYPITPGLSSQNNLCRCSAYCSQLLSSLTLNGQEYTNVGVYPNATDYYSDPQSFFINADVGIVKMTLSDSARAFKRVWELQRSKIVK